MIIGRLRLCEINVLLLDVWFLEAEMALGVKSLEIKGYQQRRHSEAGEDDERNGVVVWYELSTGGLGGDDCVVSLVGRLEHASDKLRDETQTDVLYPEDEAVRTAEDLLVDNLRH